jgi:hypothetical protein
MIDHNVMRLDITVHDALAVAVIQGLEQLVNVVPHVVVLKLWVQASEIGVVHVFEYQRRGFALRWCALAFLASTRQQARRCTQSPTQSEPSLT